MTRVARDVIPLIAIALVLLAGSVGSANASPPGGAGTIRWAQSQRKGFDTCAAPSLNTMNQWFAGSPYWDVGIYIGGISRACSQPNLTASWVTNVHNDIWWGFYLYWVPYQAPCNTIGAPKMSGDPAVSVQQGRTAADNAVAAAHGLGFTGINVYYVDIEGYPTGNSSCRTAVDAFQNGWSARIKSYWGERAGAYGSACASAVDDWWAGYTPDDAFIADYNLDPDVWGLSCVPNTHWVGGHRLHQYRGGHTETWAGITISIDNDCAYGDVSPHGHNTSGDPACTNE